MSVPTVDEDAWQQLEPGTAHPLQRLRAVRALVDAGVNAGVLMAPIVPGFSTARRKLERTIKAIADHGARFVGCNVMYPAGRDARSLHDDSSSANSRRCARASSSAVREEVRRRTHTGRRCRRWCACCRSATGCAKRKRRTRNMRPRPPQNEQRTDRVRVLAVRRRHYATSPNASARAADAAVAIPGSTTSSPSFTFTSKCDPSFQLRADRQLDVLVDEALQEARAERHVVALRHHELERLVVDRRSSCRPSRARA